MLPWDYDDRVSVKRTGAKIGVNRAFYRAMFEFSNDLVIPFEGDVSTLHHAVLERGILVKTEGGFSHRPSPGAGASFEPFLEAYRRVAVPTEKLTSVEFLRSRPSRLRRVYTVADSRNSTDLFDLDKEAITSGFVKVEKTKQPCGNVFDGGVTKAPVPRLINPRSPRFNAMLGRYTIACEHTIYQNIGELFGKPCIAKGMNMDSRATTMFDMWEDLEDPICVGQDASRFDQHTGELPLRFEHAVLQSHFPGDGTLKWLLRAQLRNVMYGRTLDGEIRAELLDMRMSGDMNTALGNCVITSALIWLRIRELGIHAYAMVDGDDSVVFMERKDYKKYSEGAHEWFLNFGYNMVIEEPVDRFEQVNFCQTQPIRVGGGWRMVREPRKALNNDYSGHQKCSSLSYVKNLFSAIGSAGLSLCSGVPVMQEFYEMGLRVGEKSLKHKKPIEMQLQGWHHLAKMQGTRKATPITDESRMSFWAAFGIPPHEQVALEEHLRSIQFDFSIQQAPGLYQDILSTTAIPVATEPF